MTMNMIKKDNPNDRNGLLQITKTGKATKKDLSRYSISTKDLKDGDIVFGFDEETEEISQLKAVNENGTINIKDEKNFNVRFIDILFRTRKEVERYKNASFM